MRLSITLGVDTDGEWYVPEQSSYGAPRNVSMHIDERAVWTLGMSARTMRLVANVTVPAVEVFPAQPEGVR